MRLGSREPALQSIERMESLRQGSVIVASKSELRARQMLEARERRPMKLWIVLL